MKKVISGVVVALLMFSLVACGSKSNDPVVGDWSLASLSFGGMTMSLAELKDSGLMGDVSIEDFFILSVKANGTFDMTSRDLITGDADSTTGKWKLNNSTYDFTGSDNIPLNFIYNKTSDTLSFTETSEGIEITVGFARK